METNYADAIPKKTLMRQSLTTNNPPFIKSGADGKVYKQTGRVRSGIYVKPKGKVYVAPKTMGVTGYDVLKPFEKIMDKKLKEKGLSAPDVESKAKLFYNQVLAAKGFNNTKPMNFESYDHADATVPDTVIPNLLTYFKSLIAGSNPDGSPLSTQDQKLSTDAKAVVADIQSSVAKAGLSPQDQVAAGLHNSTATPGVNTPFYSSPAFKTIAIVVVVIILLKMIF